jgi:hypothetical protein
MTKVGRAILIVCLGLAPVAALAGATAAIGRPAVLFNPSPSEPPGALSLVFGTASSWPHNRLKNPNGGSCLTEYYDSMYRPLSNFATHLSEGSLSLLQEPIENDAEHIIMAMHGVVSTFALFLREVEKQFPVPQLAIELEKTIQAYADFVDPKPET